MTRRFAKALEADVVTMHSLLSRPGRLPLETALHVAWAVATALSEEHARGKRFPSLDAVSIVVKPDGSMEVRTTEESDREDDDAEVGALGSVLYRLFTGVTPAQAHARLQVPQLHEPPLPSLVNPALDETLDCLIVGMLSRARPTLRVVVSVLASVLDDLGIEPSRAEVARWASDDDRAKTQPHIVVPVAEREAPKTIVRRAPRSWQFDEDEDVETRSTGEFDVGAWKESPRFDAWAALLCVFSLAVFAMAWSW